MRVPGERANGGAAWIALAVAAVLLAGVYWLLSTSHPVLPDPGTAEPIVADGPGERTAPRVDVEPAPRLDDPEVVRESGPTASRTSGWIAGTVQIDETLQGKVPVYTVIVEEAVNDEVAPKLAERVKRFQQSFAFEGRSRSSEFRFGNVPFSDYGWQVSVTAPELNGGDTVVQLSSERPGAEVYLALRKPVDVHLVVKDQDRNAVPDVMLTLRPKGRPHGRRVYGGKTDAYGLVLHSNVIQGKYELIVGDPANPRIRPSMVEVGVEKMVYQQITLPRGGTLVVEAVNISGFPVDGVQIAAIARDIQQYKKYEGLTDTSGKARLQHLPPGRYYVHATKKGYDRGFKSVTVEDKGETEAKVRLRFQ